MKLAVLTLLATLTPWAHAATIQIETCDDLELAAAATATEDTTASIITSGYTTLDCGVLNEDGEQDVRTFTVENNILTVEAPNVATMRFTDTRFDLVSSGGLLVTQDAVFQSGFDNIVETDGGFLFVGEGSKAHFLGDLDVLNYQTRSVTDMGDFASDALDGGCLSNQGEFEVDGYTLFLACDNSGGGESPPGRGGAVFNSETGTILFTGGVRIEETWITDNEGNSGAGIYNLGSVNIMGASTFYNLRADTDEAYGGGIYNGEGAEFTFGNDAAVAFIDNRASGGSALYNLGNFVFSGPALFTLNSNTVIQNRSPGYLELSSGSSFWLIETDDDLAAIVSYSGATLDYPKRLVFESLEGTSTDCDHINVQTANGFDCFS